MPTFLPGHRGWCPGPAEGRSLRLPVCCCPHHGPFGFCAPALRSAVLLPALSQPSYMYISEDRFSLSWGPSLVE